MLQDLYRLLHYGRMKEVLRVECLSLVKTLQLNFTCVLQLQKGKGKCKTNNWPFCLQGTRITLVCLQRMQWRMSSQGSHCFLSRYEEIGILVASLRLHITYKHFHGKVSIILELNQEMSLFIAANYTSHALILVRLQALKLNRGQSNSQKQKLHLK